jgi:cytochrome c-type biogenesis protein CcmH
MISILILIVLFLLLILAVIWLPFIKSLLNKQEPNSDENVRDETNIQLYHEHKAEIEKDFAQQKIDEESYQYLLTELDSSLLQEIEAEQKSVNEHVDNTRKLTLFWPVFMTIFVLVFSVYGYQQLGAYKQLSSAQLTMHRTVNEAKTVEKSEDAKLEDKLAALAERTQAEPKNSNVWYEYGKNLVLHGDFKQAVNAFDKVIEIEGEIADLYGAKAQAVYYSENQKITDEVKTLIDKALALDPLDPSTNVLLGMDSFINQRYQKAVDYWQRVLDSGRKNINTQALQGAIGEAKNRLSLTGKLKDTGSVTNPELLLEVSISDELLTQFNGKEDKVVFIYATPANGQRMPVAAVKLKVKDLPTKVVLNNARAMSPQHNLSSVKAVNIYAVISQTGSVGIKSGDYKASLANIAVSTDTPIQLVINEQVK